jgi:methionyl-tRNA synthetase
MPEVSEVSEEGNADYPVLTGDYATAATWRSRPLAVGTPLSPPTPVFRKLDESIVEDELRRLVAEAG